MTPEFGDDRAALGDMLPQDWDRIVDLCARLSGNSGAAEDLAQEVMIVGWRSQDRLRDRQRRSAWLAGIARYVCLRSTRRSRREEVNRIERMGEGGCLPVDQWLADDFDLEAEVERRERARLLHRAMAFLPPETRAPLVKSYIEERPQADVALELGLSQGALRVRLHRGKAALRHILSTEFQAEAAAYALTLQDNGWQDTGIWCFRCGRRLLLGRVDPTTQEITVRCPSCSVDGMTIAHSPGAAGPSPFPGFKDFLAGHGHRIASECRRALVQGMVSCPWCSHMNPLSTTLWDDVPASARGLHGLHMCCSNCGATANQLLAGLAFAHPQMQRFQREQERIALLREGTVEVEGRPAIVTTFESLTEASRIDVISAADTFEILSVERPSRGNATAWATRGR